MDSIVKCTQAAASQGSQISCLTPDHLVSSTREMIMILHDDKIWRCNYFQYLFFKTNERIKMTVYDTKTIDIWDKEKGAERDNLINGDIKRGRDSAEDPPRPMREAGGWAVISRSTGPHWPLHNNAVSSLIYSLKNDEENAVLTLNKS